MKKKVTLLPFAAITGILLIIYSCLFLKGEENWGISPSLFCLVLGVALFILAFCGKPEKASKTPLTYSKRVLIFTGATLVYALLFTRANFVLITAIFLFFISYITGKKSVTDNLIYSVSVSFSVYFIFNIAFGIQL